MQRGPNDPPEDPEDVARLQAEKDAQNEKELAEAKRIERERMEQREAEVAASWTKRVLNKGDGKVCFAGAAIRIHIVGRAKVDPSFVSERAKEAGFKSNSVFEDSLHLSFC